MRWEYAEVVPDREGVMLTFYHPDQDVYSRAFNDHQQGAVRMLLRQGWEPCGMAPVLGGIAFARAFRRQLVTP